MDSLSISLPLLADFLTLTYGHDSASLTSIFWEITKFEAKDEMIFVRLSKNKSKQKTMTCDMVALHYVFTYIDVIFNLILK